MKKVNVALLLLILSIILKPLYFWSSGLPQIADIISVLGIFLFSCYASKNRIIASSNIKIPLLMLSSFVFYTWFANIFLSLLYSNPEPLRNSIYYTYNIIFSIVLVLCLENIYKKEDEFFLKTLLIILCFLISSFLSVLTFIIPPDYGARYSLTFNNPNQLASYVMLLTMILGYVITFNFTVISTKLRIVILATLLFMIKVSLASQSVAAIFAILAVSGIVVNKICSVYYKVVFSLFVSLFSFFHLAKNIDYYFSDLTIRISDKILSINFDKFVNERGYDRIINHIDYIVFGAGEGIYSRLESFIIDDYFQLELHSTLGNVVFSYGIVGFILFSSAIAFMGFKDKKYIMILCCSMPYLLTHNLMRHPLLWLFLVIPIISVFKSNSKRVNK